MAGSVPPRPLRLPVSSFPLYPQRQVKLQHSSPSRNQDPDEGVLGSDRLLPLRGISIFYEVPEKAPELSHCPM